MKTIGYRLLGLALLAMTASCNPEMQGGYESKAEREALMNKNKDSATAPAGEKPGEMEDSSKVHEYGRNSVVDVVAMLGNTNTMAQAIKQSGLVDELAGEGPFTILAPTDEAFGKLSASMREFIMDPAHKEELTNVVHYNVLRGLYPTSSFKDNMTLSSAKADVMLLTVTGNDIIIHGVSKDNDARLVRRDIRCKNGIVHVIDAVMMPNDIETRFKNRDLKKQ